MELTDREWTNGGLFLYGDLVGGKLLPGLGGVTDSPGGPRGPRGPLIKGGLLGRP